MNAQSEGLSGAVIGAAIRVHEALGPGFLESVYEAALCVELDSAGISYGRQMPVSIRYRDKVIGEHRLDLLVEGHVVVELKTVSSFEPIHYATVRSYLKATGYHLGLLLNFAATTLQIKRVGREWHARHT